MALESAARSGSVDITQELLHGATDLISALETGGQWRHHGVVNHLYCSRMGSHAIADDAIGRTALQAATTCGNFELVKTILDYGVRADAPPPDGGTGWHTALQIAAHHGDIKIAELLMSYGADINAPVMPHAGSSPGTATALQEAVGGNHMQLVTMLLCHGADVNAPAAHGRRTALAAAAHHGNLEMFQLLLDHGADMKDQGASVVIAAIGNVSLESLRFLLDTWTDYSGGNLEWSVDSCDRTALEIAAERQDVELTRLLLEYEADDKSLALRDAVIYENIENVKLLLSSGAEVGCLYGENVEATTALEEAVDHLDVLRILLEHRSDRPAAYEKSRALQMAAISGNIDAARLLLNHGAGVNAAPLLRTNGADRYIRIALQAAAETSDLGLVRFPLDAGADVESKVPSEAEQATALQFTSIAGFISVVTLLNQKGADVNAPALGDNGRTALEGAAEHGRLDTVQLLLNLGVEIADSRAVQFAREEGHDGVVALLEGGSRSCSLTGIEVSLAYASY
jgi:ankyrin repeat protein